MLVDIRNVFLHTNAHVRSIYTCTEGKMIIDLVDGDFNRVIHSSSPQWCDGIILFCCAFRENERLYKSKYTHSTAYNTSTHYKNTYFMLKCVCVLSN